MRNLFWKITFIILPLFIIAENTNAQNNITDSLGRKQGLWKKYNKDTLKYEGTFKDDIPIGEFKYYYPDKKIKSVVQYSEKGLKATTISYHTNGKIMSEGEYWDKRKHGLWKIYNTSGRLVSLEDYHQGIPEGEWVTYYENGYPAEITNYSNGKKNGLWVQFCPDSIIKSKGNYADDKLDGIIYYYYLNGKVMLSGNFKQNIKDGYWMYFDELGFPEKRISYDNGKEIIEEINIRGTDNKVNFVNILNIAYIFKNDKVVVIRMNDGTDHISTREMDDFHYALNEYKFFRINTKYYVSLWSIQNRKTYSNSQRQLILKPDPGETVIVADKTAEGFLHWANLIKADILPDN